MSRRWPHLVVTSGASVALGGTFASWVQVGRRSRTSYELTAILQRLGLAPDGPASYVLRWWPLVPLIVVGAAVSGWWGKRWWSAALALLGALYAGGVGAVVLAAPVAVRIGPRLTVGGAVVMAAGGIILLSPLAAERRGGQVALAPLDGRARALAAPLARSLPADGRH